MALRLKIGDTFVIDADENTSSVPGVYLAINEDEDNQATLQWDETSSEAVLRIFILIDAASTTELASRVSAVSDAVVNADGDVVIEHTDGSDFKSFKISNGDFQTVTGRFQPDIGEQNANCLATFSFVGPERRGLGTGGSGSGDALTPQGLSGSIRYQYERNIAGAAAFIASADFRDTTDEERATGTVTLTAGSSGTINATVNGVTVGTATSFNTSLEQTARDFADAINAHTSSPDYTAQAAGAIVTIKAGAGTGTGPNGFVVAAVVTGTITASTTDMAGGKASSAGDTALANALAWVSAIKSRTGAPSFLPPNDEMRVVQDDYDFVQDGIVRATIFLREMPAALIGMDDQVRGVSYGVKTDARTLTSVDGKAGQPGTFLTISGVIQFKTEGNNAFEAADTADALTAGLIIQEVIKVKDAAIARIGAAGMIEITRNISAPGETGDVVFTITGIVLGAGVIDWQETLVARATDTAAVVPNIKGGDHVYETKGLAVVMVQHTLRIESIGGRNYEKPASVNDPRFRVIDVAVGAPQNRVTTSYNGFGFSTVINEYSRTYRLIRKDATGQSVAGDITNELAIAVDFAKSGASPSG